jgi:hypothetical protein
MSVDVIRLVKGDERPLIILTLTDDVTNTPVDLSASTTFVSIKFRAAGTTDTPAVIPCGKLTTGADGKVIFGFTGGVLDVPAGAYEGEIVINFDGQTETVYDLLAFRVRENFS